MRLPIVEKRGQTWERFAFFGAVGGDLARDDVGGMTDRKALDIDATSPRVDEPFDAVRGKDQIEVEGTVLQLDDAVPASDIGRLRGVESETQFSERTHESFSVDVAFFDEKIRVLRRVGIAGEGSPRTF